LLKLLRLHCLDATLTEDKLRLKQQEYIKVGDLLFQRRGTLHILSDVSHLIPYLHSTLNLATETDADPASSQELGSDADMDGSRPDGSTATSSNVNRPSEEFTPIDVPGGMFAVFLPDRSRVTGSTKQLSQMRNQQCLFMTITDPNAPGIHKPPEKYIPSFIPSLLPSFPPPFPPSLLYSCLFSPSLFSSSLLASSFDMS
jgi:hypothetical protein